MRNSFEKLQQYIHIREALCPKGLENIKLQISIIKNTTVVKKLGVVTQHTP